MKIAILLPGHLRAWEYCKQNFISNLYDTSHQVDVFVDTYNNVFRHDYTLHKENELKIIKENNTVRLGGDGESITYNGTQYKIFK